MWMTETEWTSQPQTLYIITQFRIKAQMDKCNKITIYTNTVKRFWEKKCYNLYSIALMLKNC